MNKRLDAKARSRAKLIETARAMFTTYPYEEVTIRRIAASANMSSGWVFSHVTGKADLHRLAMGYDHEALVLEAPRLALLVRELCDRAEAADEDPAVRQRFYFDTQDVVVRLRAALDAATNPAPAPNPADAGATPPETAPHGAGSQPS